jgi:hypothetical protein
VNLILIVEEDVEQSDVTMTVASLQLIHADNLSWQQILEFRRDSEARDKLRRLRLFAYDNYSGKPKQYIEDDILQRISDYEDAVKKWGFETKAGLLNMLLNSKMLAAGLTGSLISTLFHAPITALVTAGGGIGIEIGHVALELSKQRFAMRQMMVDNPVSYISWAKSKLVPQQ